MENRKQILSDYGYSIYEKPHPLETQASVFRDAFPEKLGRATFDKSFVNVDCSYYSEGFFIVPNWRVFEDGGIGNKDYKHAVWCVMRIFKQIRDLVSDNIHIDVTRIWRKERTSLFIEKIADKQKGHDLLVLPAQLGQKYLDRSINYVTNAMEDDEFSLGLFECLCIIYAHPHRFMEDLDLSMVCAGDEIFCENSSLRGSPEIYLFNGQISIGDFQRTKKSEAGGVVTGFIR